MRQVEAFKDSPLRQVPKNAKLALVSRPNRDPNMPNLIIGSRGSKLALWQAQWVKSELERLHDGLTVEIEIIKTTGDKLTEASLSRMPGKGVFTKEIEEALYDRTIDLAVHSLKDLPTTLPDGLHLGAITKREDPRDALIVHRRLASRVNSLLSLPVQPRIGTSSPRRAAQILHLRPDAQIFELRGNVETRLRKLDEGDFDAIILAAAGLNRLGYGARITQSIPIHHLLPAVGQGALGIETCIEDERTNFLVDSLNDWPTRNAVEAERALLKGLGGGCAVPIAAFGQIEPTSDGAQLKLEALVSNLAGTKIVRHEVIGSQYKCEELGSLLARHLIAAGAYELLHEETAPIEDFRAETPALAFVSPTPTTNGLSHLENLPTSRTNAAVAYDLRSFYEEREPEEASPSAELTEEFGNEPSLVESQQEEWAESLTEEWTESQHEAAFDISSQASSEPANAPFEMAAEPLPEVTSSQVEVETPPLLAGKRIIVTRARHQADGLAQRLQSYGAEVVLCPTIEIRPPDSWHAVDEAISKLRYYQWLVFTSSNGVTHFLRRFDETGHGRAELAGLKICAVGKKTTERLQEERLQVDLMPQRFTAENLASAFIRKFGVGQRLRGMRMLLPAAKATRDVIRPSLEKVGVTVDVVETYQNVLPNVSNEEIVSLISQQPAHYVIFTSPSTVNNLAVLLDSDQLISHLPSTRVACIGPVTAKAAEQCGLTVHLLPEEHTAPAIVELLIKDSQIIFP
jgi:hydroxymethylbilane synthase